MEENTLTLQDKKYDLNKCDEETRTSILQILSRAQRAQANLSSLQADADIQATALKTFTDA